jgi:hypothetical protein
MPDLKISELTQDTTPAGTDEVALQRGGTSNVRSTLAECGAGVTITDHAVPRGSGGTFQLQDSGVIIDDSDNVTGVVAITATGDIDTTGDVTGFVPGAVNASTSITAADTMRGQIVYCTAGTTVTFTINNAASTDLFFAVCQFGAGQVQFAAGNNVTLRYDSTYNPYTAAQYAIATVHVKANDGDVIIAGNLEEV